MIPLPPTLHFAVGFTECSERALISAALKLAPPICRIYAPSCRVQCAYHMRTTLRTAPHTALVCCAPERNRTFAGNLLLQEQLAATTCPVTEHYTLTTHSDGKEDVKFDGMYNKDRVATEAYTLAPVAQWIERPPPKGQVEGSIPFWGASATT